MERQVLGGATAPDDGHSHLFDVGGIARSAARTPGMIAP
jgi:hypothetical protein